MVQNTNAPSRRGRPPKFDADAVVAAAIGAFMAKGFDATTLNDIETATGVDRSTLYNSFGGKAGLYKLATDTYLTSARLGLFATLHDGTRGLDDVTDFLSTLRQGLTSQDEVLGCLIVNDMSSGSDTEAADCYQDLLESGILAALERASSRGEADADRSQSRAALILTTVLGINLVASNPGTKGQVGRLVEAAIAEVETWRT